MPDCAHSGAMLDRTNRLKTADARALAAQIGCDPRTIQKAARGERLAPLTAARVLPVLRARGLLPLEASP